MPDNANGRVHVVMPATGTGTGHGKGVPQHTARIAYDAAYERESARHLDGTLAWSRLEHFAVELTTPEQTRANTGLPLELLSLDSVVREPLARDRVSLAPGGRVQARISLGSGGVLGWDRGALWTFGQSSPRPGIWQVRWQISHWAGDCLNWTRRGLDGTADAPLPTLYPIADAIELHIYHVLPGELAPFAMTEEVPKIGALATDFAAYYDLFDHPANPPLPQYRGTEYSLAGVNDTVSGPANNESVIASGEIVQTAGPHPVTCLCAQASLR